MRRCAKPDRSRSTARRPSPACVRPAGWWPTASTCWSARSSPASPPSASTAWCSSSPWPTAPGPSINPGVFHGIPNEKPLKEGDIVNVDVTLILDGWHGDSSRMFPIGAIPRRAERLIDVTYDAMMRGISVIRPGATTGDIGAAIQTFVEAQHMSVVRDFCGHGLGRLFHDEPNIVHVGRPGEGMVFRPGMLFTVEPMINLGRPHVKGLSDGWTAGTGDRSLRAQFAHTSG